MSASSELELVRERMFHAWDGVESLEIHLLEKHRTVWRVRVEEASADFRQTEPDIPVYHSQHEFLASDEPGQVPLRVGSLVVRTDRKKRQSGC